MRLTEPAQAYCVLWQALTGSKVSVSHAESLLQEYFTTPRPDKRPVVLVMDELDLLVNKRQSVVYNFFDWPNLKHSRLIVVAIANTMDLPERMLTNKVSSRLGLARISFTPYQYKQLHSIIESRLEGIIEIDQKAIELCARKIAAVSGDARRALDLCRRAIEMIESSGERARVEMRHIERAFADLFQSPVLQALKHISFHQRLFLVAVFRKVREKGCSHVEYGDVMEEHRLLATLQNRILPTFSQMAAICSFLSDYKLLLAEPAKRADPSQKIQVIRTNFS